MHALLDMYTIDFNRANTLMSTMLNAAMALTLIISIVAIQWSHQYPYIIIINHDL